MSVMSELTAVMVKSKLTVASVMSKLTAVLVKFKTCSGPVMADLIAVSVMSQLKAVAALMEE